MTTEIIPADPTLVRGALADALAKAQSTFPPIPRDKEVTVESKTGKSYKFKYAPLDSILTAVRKPLADNGLAITQLLDDGDLVTTLMHSGGGVLSGRIGLPNTGDSVQALGSAITYLRRYSIQAILGIAAEEDDDGNHASGNTATFAKPDEAFLPDGGLIGTAITQGTQDGELRQSPTGWTLPFRIKNGSKSYIVIAENELAEALSVIKETWIGQRVTAWGRWSDETIPAKGTKPEIRYKLLHLERIVTPDGTLPAPGIDEPPEDVRLLGEREAETAPLFDGVAGSPAA